jgi:hypothetical protein
LCKYARDSCKPPAALSRLYAQCASYYRAALCHLPAVCGADTASFPWLPHLCFWAALLDARAYYELAYKQIATSYYGPALAYALVASAAARKAVEVVRLSTHSQATALVSVGAAEELGRKAEELYREVGRCCVRVQG